METKRLITYTLYSHNLWEPHKSFDPNITVKDFGRKVWTEILKADKIVYVNPRGLSIILKDKNGTKSY